MAFKNEYIPPLEQETSEFFRKAREVLRTGHYKTDDWTVDRENNRVLGRTGCGHEIDDHDEEYWKYLDGDDCYGFTTKELNYSLISHIQTLKLLQHQGILEGLQSSFQLLTQNHILYYMYLFHFSNAHNQALLIRKMENIQLQSKVMML